TVPHLYVGALTEVFAHQVWLRIQAFEIGADGAAFGERRSIVQLERRDLVERAERQITGLLVFLVHDGEIDARDGVPLALLAQEVFHAIRIGRLVGDVELYRPLLLRGRL